MKEPTKDQLREQIAALTRENIKLQRKLEAEEFKKWEAKTGQAVNMLYRAIPFLPREICNLTLSHIDKAGYWFTFQLRNDSQIQTYCVRHTDL